MHVTTNAFGDRCSLVLSLCVSLSPRVSRTEGGGNPPSAPAARLASAHTLRQRPPAAARPHRQTFSACPGRAREGAGLAPAPPAPVPQRRGWGEGGSFESSFPSSPGAASGGGRLPRCSDAPRPRPAAPSAAHRGSRAGPGVNPAALTAAGPRGGAAPAPPSRSPWATRRYSGLHGAKRRSIGRRWGCRRPLSRRYPPAGPRPPPPQVAQVAPPGYPSRPAVVACWTPLPQL